MIDTLLLLYLCVIETWMLFSMSKKKTKRRRLPKNVIKLEQSWWNRQ